MFYLRVVSALENDVVLDATLSLLFAVFWISLNVIVVSASQLAEYTGLLQPVYHQAGSLVFFFLLVSGQFASALLLKYWNRLRRLWTPPHYGLVTTAAIASVISVSLASYMFFGSHARWFLPGLRPLLYPLVLGAIASTTAAASLASPSWVHPVANRRASHLRALSLFLWMFTIYVGTSMALERYFTPSKAYFHLLADAMTRGQLFLSNPPSTHDLAFYRGNWYVVHPPLVALLMIPSVLAIGPSQLNTVSFSSVLAAGSVALLYLILEEMSALGWTRTRAADNTWLAILFGLGFGLWWVAIDGEFWFLSQVAVVAFVALSSLLCIRGAHPFLVGAALGMAVLGRPTALFVWPFLVGVAAQNQLQAEGTLRLRSLVRWSLLSLLGMAVGVLGLFLYNWTRFGSAFDTGFIRQNIAPWLASDLKDFGLFHPHYIVRNLRVMLLNLPAWNGDCRLRIDPSEQGMSIILATPALLFLVRARGHAPWVLGAWSAVAASTAVLLLYYSTGAWQFGYRYILDFAVPLVALLALASGKRMSLLLTLCIVASAVINAVGTAWWFGVWC